MLANSSTELLTGASLINSRIRSRGKNSNLAMSKVRTGTVNLDPYPLVMRNAVLTHAVSTYAHLKKFIRFSDLTEMMKKKLRRYYGQML